VRNQQVPPVGPIEPVPVVPAPAVPAPSVVDPSSVPQPPYSPYGYGQQQPYSQQPGQPYAYYAAQQPPRGLSITSMVLGIGGVFFSLWYGLGLFPSIAAIITGHIAQRRQPAGKGFWIAGLICGYVGLLLSLIGVAILVFVIIYALAAANDPSSYGDY
jgi:hypothetical protein